MQEEITHMNAARVEKFGGVEEIMIQQQPLPEPQDGHVLIKIKAVGLNFSDGLQLAGDYPGGALPPYIPGIEAAGVIVQCGKQVRRRAVGERVMVINRQGLLADYAAVPAKNCFPLPAFLSFSQGAALPVQFLTALTALTSVGRARRGDTVLIHAAAGGLGLALLQLAGLLGLQAICCASTEEKRDFLLSKGADYVADYENFSSICRQATGGRGPDIIIDSIGGAVFRKNLKLLPPLGKLIVVGLASGEAVQVDSARLLFNSRSVLGLHLDAIVARRSFVQQLLRRIYNWIRREELRINVAHQLPLADLRQAFRLLHDWNRIGKIVLTTDNSEK